MEPNFEILRVPTRTRGRRITAGKLTGQKPALKMKEVWAIRARLEFGRRVRDLALFHLAIDSKLRGWDLIALRVEDVAAGGEVKTRGVIVQRKTGRPVQFEITAQTRAAVGDLLAKRRLQPADYLFPIRVRSCRRGSTPESFNAG